jgi:hypothetical protein
MQVVFKPVFGTIVGKSVVVRGKVWMVMHGGGTATRRRAWTWVRHNTVSRAASLNIGVPTVRRQSHQKRNVVCILPAHARLFPRLLGGVRPSATSARKISTPKTSETFSASQCISIARIHIPHGAKGNSKGPNRQAHSGCGTGVALAPRRPCAG